MCNPERGLSLCFLSADQSPTTAIGKVGRGNTLTRTGSPATPGSLLMQRVIYHSGEQSSAFSVASGAAIGRDGSTTRPIGASERAASETL
jgi:hypothetical protein